MRESEHSTETEAPSLRNAKLYILRRMEAMGREGQRVNYLREGEMSRGLNNVAQCGRGCANESDRRKGND